jgi:serine/threonine protein kinase
MDAASSLHPTEQILNSYGMGKLADGLAKAVHQHLEQCPNCRKRVAEMSADYFSKRVRDAQNSSGKSAFGLSTTAGVLSAGSPNASAPPPAGTLPPGLANHPDYEIKRELGRGGMGVVYLVHNKLMGRDEVFKVMGRHIMERPGVVERFLREIRAVAKLRHPNIVTAYHAARLGESIVFAMEYVEGLDLSRMVKSKGPLPVAHACNFVHQAALGLQHAHEHGLVHRDIKPGNLMLSCAGDKALIKVLDFGLAKVTREEKFDGGLTVEGQALGTPGFIAPEQILDAQSADIRADIYSLGCTLFALLAGRPPFQADSLYDLFQAHISRDADPLNFVRPEVPSELAALVTKMMAKDPNRRFQTPGEVARALTPFFKRRNAACTIPSAQTSWARSNAGLHLTSAVVVLSGPASESRGSSGRSRKEAEQPTAEAQQGNQIVLRRMVSSAEATASVAPVRRVRRAWLSLITGIVLVGFVVLWGVLLRIKTSSGTIELVDLPQDAEVYVDGQEVSVTWRGEGEPALITVPAGKHRVEIKNDGLDVSSNEITIGARAKQELTVRLNLGPISQSGNGGESALRPEEPKTVDTTRREGAGPFAETPPKPLSAARPLDGEWTVEGDELVQSSNLGGAVLIGEMDWSRYDLTLDAKYLSAEGRCRVLFHRQGPTFVCRFNWDIGGYGLCYWTNGKWSRRWENNQSAFFWDKNRIKVDRWYSIKLEVRGKSVKCFVDGDLIFEDTHPTLAHGQVALEIRNSQGRFRRISVTSPDGSLLWKGPPTLDSPDAIRFMRGAAPAPATDSQPAAPRPR